MNVNDLNTTENLSTDDLKAVKGGFRIQDLLSRIDLSGLINTGDFDQPLGDDLYEGDGTYEGAFGSDMGPIGDGKK